MATRGWALLALLACAALSPLTAQAQDTTISLDGSGNSNFLPLLLRVLETIKVRAKPQPVVSYRSIGTGPGQTELTTTNITLFACGGGKALDATTYANIPVVVSTVSVYVNLNGLQSGQLQLAPCTLAGIYKGDITNWKDIPPADNPSNFTLPDAPIISLYHEEGSSSTLAFTTYLSRACPTFGTTTSLTFTDVVPTPPATSVAVGTTTDMVEQLSSVAGAIGYSEPGQAMAAGLVEVAIQNAANPPLYVYYEQQGPATRVAVPSFSTTTAADWTDKDLTYKSNNWPMAVVNFIQMRRNMQGMGPAGGLARKIAEFFYSQEVIDLLPDYALRPAFNFAPDDETTRGQIIGTVQTLVTVDQAWDDTETKVADPAYATKPYTISALRQGYVLDSVTQLFDVTDKTRSAIKQGGTYQLHGGGAFQAADFMRSLMSNLQSQARAPIHATYRDVGTVQAQSEIADVTLSIPNLNNFKVGDAPLESAVWTQLTNCTVDECPGVLHLPFAIGSVSIFFNQQLPSNYLGLQPCMASQIFSGTITQWSDPKLNPDPSVNNGFALGDASDSYVKQPMTVFVYASQSSANRILKAWLATCAGSTWTVDLSPLPATGNVFSNYSITDPKTGKVLQTIPINTPQDMAAALSSTPHSIGFMPSNLGIEQNLDEAALLDIAGGDSYIRTKDTLLTAASNKKLDAGLVFQQLVAAQNLQTKPADSDWSTVSFLTPANGAGGYPLVTLLYVYVYQDLKGFGDSGPLTKALFQYMYSDKGQQLLVASGLQPLPPQLITHFRGELNKLTFAPLLAEWQFETADRITNAGMGLQTFSEVRESSEQALLSSLSDSVGQIQQQVASGVVVRGAGPASAGLSTLVRSMMDDLTAFSSFPVRFNFEEVPDASMPRITSLLVNQSTVSSKVAFLVMDQPLTTAQRQSIPGVVLQSPLMVRPLALLYNNGAGNSTNSTSTTANSTTASNTTTAAAPAPLRMSPCTLAGIVNGKITYWDDAAITGDNPGVSLPHNLIQLRAGFGDTSSDAANPTAGAAASGNIKAIIDYVTATCTSEPVNLGSQKFIASDDVVADVLASEAYSILAVGDPSAVDATLGVQDFALQNIPVNTAVAALSGNFSHANQSTAQQYSDCLLLKVVPNTEDYRLVLDDWSDFTIAGNCQPPSGAAPADGFDAETVASSEVYPLMRVDFLVMPADLKNFSYAGGAIVGMVNYLFQSGFWQSDSLATALPSAAPLPEQQAARSRDMVILLQTADGTPDWPVITSSLDDSVPLSATDRPFITSYAKPVYLATGGYGGGLGGAVSLAAARQAAQEFLAANAQKYTAKVESKDSSTAKTMAIVALAICLVLSLLALAVAGLALRDARRALANSYRPGSLAQVLPATQGMQIMAQMNANPPPLHPAAAALASPSGRKAKGAVLNPTYSYNSRTAPRKPTNGLGGGALGGLTRCLTGQSEDERYKGFMDHQHTAPSEASSASPPPDVKIQMRPNV